MCGDSWIECGRRAHYGLCHHCWGEGIPLMWDYDLATVDCWQFYSTCHCLQRSRQFELGVREVCTRAGAAGGRVSYNAEGVPTWDAGGGGIGGANSSGVDGGASCCIHQGAATESAQPIIITVCGGRWGGGRGDETSRTLTVIYN